MSCSLIANKVVVKMRNRFNLCDLVVVVDLEEPEKADIASPITFENIASIRFVILKL